LSKRLSALLESLIHFTDDNVVKSVLVSGYPSIWAPIPALEPPSGSTTTILFINSGKILYPLQRDDPIFPAMSPITIPIGGTYFINERGHAGVIACIDRTEFRDPTKKTHWTSVFQAEDPTTDDAQSKGGFWLLMNSLVYSNIYQSISTRSADALDAQKHLANKYSFPLPAEQWKVEVKQLFKTSLARIQIQARDIARGAAAHREGYYKIDLDLDANMCDNTYLFNSEGYQNVNFVGYWAIFGICGIIILLAIPSDDKKLWPEMLLDYGFVEDLENLWNSIFGHDGFFIKACRWLTEPFCENGFLHHLAKKILRLLQGWTFRRRAHVRNRLRGR